MEGSTIFPQQYRIAQSAVPDAGMALSITSAASQCRRSFQSCLKLPKLQADDWADNRLAEFNLWASSTGTFAGDKASLDSRLALEWDTKSLVISLLAVLLECLLRCQNICVVKEGEEIKLHKASNTQISNVRDEKEANDDIKGQEEEEEGNGDSDSDEVDGDKNENNRQDPIERSFSPWSDSSSSDSDIDESESSSGVLAEPLAVAKGEVAKILDHLHRLMIAIRKSGTNSRAHKADKSFNPEAYSKLRSHLNVVVLARGSEKGRSLFTVDPTQLTIVQERLIMANLRRQHRYLYAHRHAQKLAAEEKKEKYTFPLQTEGEWAHINVHDSAQLGLPPPSTRTSQASRSQKIEMPLHLASQPAFTATSASAVAQPIEQIPSSQIISPSQVAKTNITATTAKIVYPQPPSKGSLNYFKCPCCSQALPDMYRQPTHWKKHLMADICPYTCVIEDCPKPDLLHKSWNEMITHIEEDHQQCWKCLPCTLPGAKPIIFPSVESFLDHLRQAHESTIREEHFSTLLSESSCPVPSGISRCPLCDSNGPADSPLLMEHIAEHIHAFALLSLPWPRSGDDEQGMNDDITKNFFRDVDYFHEGSENESHGYNVSSGSERDSSGLLSWHSGSNTSEVHSISGEGFDEGADFSNSDLLGNELGAPVEFEVCPLPEVSWAPELPSVVNDARNNIVDGDLIDPRDFTVVDSRVLLQLKSLLDSYMPRYSYQTRQQAFQSSQSNDGVGMTTTTPNNTFLSRVVKPRIEKRKERVEDTEMRVSGLFAERKYEDVVSHLERILGGRNTSGFAMQTLSLTCLDRLARSYFLLARYDDAVNVASRLLASQRRIAAGPDALETVILLGRIFQACGKFEDAEKVLSEEMQDKLVSGDGMSFEIRMELATTKISLRKYEEAVALLEQIFDLQKVDLSQSARQLFRTKQELVKVYRLMKDTEKLINMLDLLAQSHRASRQYSNLETVRRESLALRRNSLDSYHPLVIRDLEDLATAYIGQNRFSLAEEVQKEIVQSYKASLGPTNSNTLTSMRNLVLTHYKQGQIAAAKEIEMKILETEESLMGFEDQNTALSLKNIALTYRDRNQHEKALPLLRHALKLQKSTIGPNEAATLETMDDFAQCLYELNQFQEATDIQDELSRLRPAALGHDHPLVLRDIHRCAQTQEKFGFPVLAERLMTKALEERKKILGEDHPDTLESLVDLTTLYWNRGQAAGKDRSDLRSALRIQVQVVDYYQRNHGPHEPETLQNMEKLGDIHFATGDFHDAKFIYKQAVASREEALGSSHVTTLNSMEKLVNIHSSLKEHQSAIILQSQVVAGKRLLFGTEDIDTLRSINCLGSMYSDLALWAHAERILTEVVETTRQKAETGHDEAITAMHLLAGVYQKQRQLEKAEEIWLQVLQKLKSMDTSDSSAALLTEMRYIVAFYNDEKMWENAEKILLEILSLESSSDNRDTLSKLAYTYAQRSMWVDAERIYNQLIDGSEKAGNFADLDESIDHLKTIYYNQGRQEEAKKLEVRLLEIKTNILGRDHPDALDTSRALSSAYHSQGLWLDAEPLDRYVMEISSKSGSKLQLCRDMEALAETYSALGKKEDEESLREELLWVQRLASFRPDTMICESKLAELYQLNGKFDKAMALAMEVYHSFSTTTHVQGGVELACVTRIASIFKAQYRPEIILDFLVPFLDDFTEVVGTDLNDIAFEGLWLCANAYRFLGKGKAGADFAFRTIPTLETKLGSNRRETIRFKFALAFFYNMQGLLDEAEPLLAHLIDTTTLLWEADDETLLQMKELLGSIHQERDNLKKSENPTTEREAKGKNSSSSTGFRSSMKSFFKRAKDI